MELKKLLSAGLVAGMIATQGSFAQAQGPKFSGHVNTTYSYDFNRPVSRRTSYRTFDFKQDSFLINSFQLNVQGDMENGIGYYAEVMAGEDAATSNLTSNDTKPNYFNLQEAFVTYKCNITGLNLKAGKFATFQGIEVIESGSNYNISRGFLFGLAEPLTHVGALAGYQVDGIGDVWVGVVNGWDVDSDNNTGKTLVAKIGIAGNELISGNVSMIHGSEVSNTNNTRTSFDTVWTVNPVSQLSLALQFNAGQEEAANKTAEDSGATAHWYGASVQPKVTLSDEFSIGSRYEWFSDLGRARSGNPNIPVQEGQILQTISVTPTLNLSKSLMFRVEYRYDWSTKLVYEDSTGAISKGETSSISTEFVYKF